MWAAKTNVALIFASIAVLLGAAAFVTAFVVDPPPLGWIGFAIASALVIGLGPRQRCWPLVCVRPRI